MTSLPTRYNSKPAFWKNKAVAFVRPSGYCLHKIVARALAEVLFLWAVIISRSHLILIIIAYRGFSVHFRTRALENEDESDQNSFVATTANCMAGPKIYCQRASYLQICKMTMKGHRSI